jgi:hypothetical protein
MKYTLHNLKDENGDPLFCILENITNQVVDAFLFEDDARNRFDFLKRGGAFDGFTPAFILRKVLPKSDLNKEFKQMLRE